MQQFEVDPFILASQTKSKGFRKSLQSKIQSLGIYISEKVSAHPGLTIFFYLLVVVVLAAGLLNIDDNRNNDTIDLFTPSDGRNRDEKAVFNKYYTTNSDAFTIVAVPKDPKKLFDTAVMTELLTHENALTAMADTPFTSVCSSSILGGCTHLSPFMYFNYNADTLASSEKIDTICGSTQNYIPFFYVFGRSQNVTVDNCRDPNYGLIKATAVSIYLPMNNTNIESKKKSIQSFLRSAAKQTNEFAKNSKHWNVYHMSNQAMGDEVERGANTAITRVAISMVIVGIVVLIALFVDSFWTSFFLSVTALIGVLLGVLMGLGLSQWVALEWTTITPVIIFLAIGLGIDNAVVLTVFYYREDPSLSVVDRNINACAESLIYNILTSLTTILAFLMGVFTSLKGVQQFCLSSALVMFFNLISVYTFFDACLVIILGIQDKRKKKRGDKSVKKQKKKGPSQPPIQEHDDEGDDSFITAFYRKCVGPLIDNKVAEWIIVVVFIGFSIFEGFYATNMKEGIKAEDAVPNDSYVLKYLENARPEFEAKISQVHLIFKNDKDNYFLTKPTRRNLISQVVNATLSAPYVMPVSENPVAIFDKYLIDKGTDPNDVKDMDFFTEFFLCILSNPRLLEHTSLNLTSIENFSIPSVKAVISGQAETTTDLDIGKVMMMGIRDILDGYNREYGDFVESVSYGSMFPYFDMLGSTLSETIINMTTSAIVVIVVVSCLLPFSVTWMVIFTVILIDVNILAWIPHLSLTLSAITSVCLVMAIGVAVDFASHIAHAFTETDPTLPGHERARLSVIKMGRSLTTSALTTFSGVLLLAFVPVPTNRTFFFMLSGVVMYGYLYGMLFLPSLLALVNPMNKSMSESEFAQYQLSKQNSHEEKVAVWKSHHHPRRRRNDGEDMLTQEEIVANARARKKRMAVPPEPQPETAQPETAQPVATQPVATQPVATQPVATQPVATQPVATQPVATQSRPIEDMPSDYSFSQPLPMRVMTDQIEEPPSVEPEAVPPPSSDVPVEPPNQASPKESNSIAKNEDSYMDYNHHSSDASSGESDDDDDEL